LLELDESKITIDILQDKLKEIGVNAFLDYKEGESNICTLSREKKYIVELDEFTDDEIEEEYYMRDL